MALRHDVVSGRAACDVLNMFVTVLDKQQKAKAVVILNRLHCQYWCLRLLCPPFEDEESLAVQGEFASCTLHQ